MKLSKTDDILADASTKEFNESNILVSLRNADDKCSLV
jgi:hypothetical protein